MVELGLPPGYLATAVTPSVSGSGWGVLADSSDSPAWDLLHRRSAWDLAPAPAPSQDEADLHAALADTSDLVNPAGAGAYWSRGLLAAALFDEDGADVRLADGLRARMLDLPGADAQVGLVTDAYAQTSQQVQAVRQAWQRARWDAPSLDWLAETLQQTTDLGEAYPDDGGWRWLIQEQNPAGPLALLGDPTGSSPGAAVDQLGRVIVLGPSWLSGRQHSSLEDRR